MSRRSIASWIHSAPLRFFLWLLIVSAIMSYSAWSVHSKERVATSDYMSVTFLDVGQGDAIYIRTPNGSDALIDAGPTTAISEDLRSVMPANDTDLDLVIATHADQDHIGGLPTVFDTYTVRNFITTEKKTNTKTFQKLTEKITTEPGMKMTLARAGQRITLDAEHGVYIDILFPDASAENIKDTNEASIVFELAYGESEFLFTGDAPDSVEHFLVTATPKILATDVLKLGHHGSKTSSSDEFLTATGAKYAVVSSGKNNKYNHPSPEVVERAARHGMQLFNTATNGAITFITDGATIWQP